MRLKLGILLLVAGILPALGQDVLNKIPDVEVAHVEFPNETSLRLTVTNRFSSQSISEFIVSMDGFVVRSHFWGLQDELLQPGASRTLEYSTSSPLERVTVEGVLFADGTGDGDPMRLRESLMIQEGYLEELDRSAAILAEFLSKDLRHKSDFELLDEIAILREKLESSPKAAADNVSDEEFWAQTGRKAGVIVVPELLRQLEKQMQRSNFEEIAATRFDHDRLVGKVAQIADKCRVARVKLAHRK